MTAQLDLLRRGKRGRFLTATKLPEPTERVTHINIARILKRFKNPGWLHNHFPAGELRTKETAALLKDMGLQPGWPDFVLIGPDGQHYYLELKRGRQALTEAQRQFQIDMNMRGVPCAVARSERDALIQLREWGAIRVAVAA
jgi:hypothetical protein